MFADSPRKFHNVGRLDFLGIEAFIHRLSEIVYIFIHECLWISGKPEGIEIPTKTRINSSVKKKLSTFLFVIISQFS